MISPARLTYHGEKYKKVKNLGWLLRNWKLVRKFHVIKSSNPDDDAYLIAILRDGGRTYETGFASRKVLWEFLDRPVFRGAKLLWSEVDGTIVETVCGGTKPEELQ